jgi:hypothetical protein
MPSSLLTPEQWVEVAVAYEAGEKPADLAKRFEISVGALNWNMLREGASRPGAKRLPQIAPGPMIMRRGNHVVRHFSKEEDAQMLELARAGKNTSEIARAIGRCWNSTRGRLMTLARHDDRNGV